MAQVITFEDYVPAPRYDSIPWTQVEIEEGTSSVGPWTVIDTIALSPVDADPAHPAARAFTTELASDTAALFYRVVFLDATGDDTLPTVAIQNIVEREPYASVDELAQLLRVNADTRHAALRRVLLAAAEEIDAEVGITTPYATAPALVVEVNLERAVEHWQQMQSPFGIIGLGSEIPTHVGRDSWDRHAHKLAPLKEAWGLA